MLNLNNKQWWVIWSAVTLALVIWWSGLRDAAWARAQASPTYVREVAAATRDYEKDGNIQTFNFLLKTSLDSALAEAYRVERTTRAFASVVAVAAFLVWRLGGRT